MMHPSLKKPVREIDDQYRAWIRTKVCCISSIVHECTGPTEAHHVPKFGLKGTGTKVSDRRCVPVCFNAHRYCEQNARHVAKHLEATIVYLNARYRKEVKPKLTPPRTLKKARLKIEGTCPAKHRVNIALSKLVKVKGGWRWWCDRCNDYMEVA